MMFYKEHDMNGKFFYDEQDVTAVSKRSFWIGVVAGIPLGWITCFLGLWALAEYLGIQ